MWQINKDITGHFSATTCHLIFFVVLRPDRQPLFEYVEEYLEKEGFAFLYNPACFLQQGPLEDLSFTSPEKCT